MKRPTRSERKILKAKARHKRQAHDHTFACGRCGLRTRTAAGNYGGRSICTGCAAILAQG